MIHTNHNHHFSYRNSTARLTPLKAGFAALTLAMGLTACNAPEVTPLGAAERLVSTESPQADKGNTPSTTPATLSGRFIEKPIQPQGWEPVSFPASAIRLPHQAPPTDSLDKGHYDSSFDSSTGISLSNSATFDSTHAKSGNRSIYLGNPGDSFKTAQVPVNEDAWYQISGYMLLSSGPRPITNILIQVYDKSGRWAYNAADYTFSVASSNEWEEFLSPVYIKRGYNAGSLRVSIRYKETPDAEQFSRSDIWIDDLRINSARDSSQLFGYEAAKPRKAFDGEKTRIDALGNWEVKENGRWKPFFPLVIYPDFNADWSKYAAKGFNTVTQIGYPAQAKKAIDANLHWMWDITPFLVSERAIIGGNIYPGDTALLEQRFNAFKEKTGLKGMLSYYWDNEDLNEWDSVRAIATKLKQLDTVNKRSRPIYMNSKHEIANPLFMNSENQFIDIQGCYINPINHPDGKQYQPEWAMFLASDKMEGIKSPTGIGIINVPHEGDYIEPLIFAGIARGMRGFGFWRDGFQGRFKIEDRAWWSSFDKTAAKINAMLPLIREPHWTSWPLDVSIPEREDTLVVGKRDYNNKRHIIIASLANTQQSVTFTTDKQLISIRNFFSGKVVATPNSNTFTLTIQPHESTVLVLE